MLTRIVTTGLIAAVLVGCPAVRSQDESTVPTSLAVARVKYPHVTFDWAAAHPRVAERFLAQFLRSAAAYPEVALKLRNVSVVRFTGAGEGKNGYAYPDGTQIIVNLGYARSAYNAGDAPRLCRHEFGHQVLNYLAAHPETRAEFVRWRRQFSGNAGDADHVIIRRWLERDRTPAKVRQLYQLLRGGE